MEVKVAREDEASIMVLMLKRIIQKNLKDEKVVENIKNLKVSIVIKVGRMRATLYFKEGEITLENGEIESPSAEIEGSLKSFLNIALGRNFVVPMIMRELKIRGNILNLLKLLPLMNLFKI